MGIAGEEKGGIQQLQCLTSLSPSRPTHTSDATWRPGMPLRVQPLASRNSLHYAVLGGDSATVRYVLSLYPPALLEPVSAFFSVLSGLSLLLSPSFIAGAALVRFAHSRMPMDFHHWHTLACLANLLFCGCCANNSPSRMGMVSLGLRTASVLVMGLTPMNGRLILGG